MRKLALFLYNPSFWAHKSGGQKFAVEYQIFLPTDIISLSFIFSIVHTFSIENFRILILCLSQPNQQSFQPCLLILLESIQISRKQSCFCPAFRLQAHSVRHLTTCLPTDSENRPTRDGIPWWAGRFVSTGLSAPAFSGLEGGHSPFWLGNGCALYLRLCDALVDLHRCPLAHLVGDMGVGV